ALDAIQWPRHPLHGPTFQQPEQARLADLGLWEVDRVVPDIHLRVGRALYARLVAGRDGEIALRTARDSATEKGLPLTYILRFPPEAIELAALPWETLC